MQDASRPFDHGDHWLTLDDILPSMVADGVITRQQSERLRFLSKQAGDDSEHPVVLVANQGWQTATVPHLPLDVERLTRWLAEAVGLEYLRIDPLKVDVGAVTAVVKRAYATRFGILPVRVVGRRVTVATAEPYVRSWEHELTASLDIEIERVLASPAAVARYLNEFYSISKTLSGAATSRAGAPTSGPRNFEQLVELDGIGEPDADDQHVVRIVDWLLQYAFDQRASDIHLEPRREDANIRFRIDGQLHLVNQVPNPVLNAVVSRLKALGRMDVIERRRPQDGRIRSKTPGGREVELRLSTMPTTFGEKLVMRIFDPEVLIRSFEDLGFSRHDRALWTRMMQERHGMLVVTGPTGSGKTTTLYSALKHLARPELNICTIEDPIELVDSDFNQMHVQAGIGLDFASGVRTLLRQDPDIVMVGEIRDRETAQTAIQAALTGHLVLTTLHTNDAPSSVTRLLDLGIAPYLIKSALLGVVAQRLIRTLCPHCKVRAPVNADEWRALVHPWKVPLPDSARAAGGCDECRHTGYAGRIGIYEILAMSDAVRALVTADAEASAIRRQGYQEGMRPLRLSGAEKVKRGLTTPSEIFNVVQAAELDADSALPDED